MDIRTRMAPSPTGNLHLGTAYATMWSYLLARKNKGTFILRIEDTDQERSTKEFAENIISGLKWLGFDFDEGPFHQMDRLKIYQNASQKLLDEEKAYFCFCTKEELGEERKRQAAQNLPQIYSGKCRNLTPKEVGEKKKQGQSFVIRYKLPEGRGKINFEDLIHGLVEFDSKLLGDMVIMRGNWIPLYNFAVVVDDADMKITHVLRGDDHLSNTPKQILFFEALGQKPPFYGHYPVILNQDRVGKLSKRTGSTSMDEYKKDGFLPEAIFNYLALLGWTPPNDLEILSKDQIIEFFNVSDMNKSASAWNEEKLEWINGEYIRKTQNSKLRLQILEYLKGLAGGVMTTHPTEDEVEKIIPLIKERIKKLSDFIPLTAFLWEKPDYDNEVLQKLNINNLKEALGKVLEEMEQMPRPWNGENFEDTFKNLARDLNLSNTQMFQLIRAAVSGQLVTPPLFDSIKILGEEETISRVKTVLAIQ